MHIHEHTHAHSWIDAHTELHTHGSTYTLGSTYTWVYIHLDLHTHLDRHTLGSTDSTYTWIHIHTYSTLFIIALTLHRLCTLCTPCTWNTMSTLIEVQYDDDITIRIGNNCSTAIVLIVSTIRVQLHLLSPLYSIYVSLYSIYILLDIYLRPNKTQMDKNPNG